MNEATARLKINKLLESAGWRFFDEGDKPANIRLEAGVEINTLGDNFEKTRKGFIDFLLLDDRGFPLIVLEAKAEEKQPLVGKEQARKYARSQNCRFVILSNGNLHYFWDLDRGNPHIITAFPTPDSVTGYQKTAPNPQRLIDERVSGDYIVLTQRPNYASEAAWKNEAERPSFLHANKLRFLRSYQLQAVHALQRAVKDGKDRFLFEMATGTGKTLTAAAIIKLFLRSSNASRVLFLVDRLELEDQAKKVFTELLSADFETVIYKENRDDWRRAEIVVSTVQSFQFDNKYQKIFSPTDFDFVISDEAHRSISGNARAVFDYFVGYKLGLTATPRDYLRGIKTSDPAVRDPREIERRLLLDTYRTFGCESGQPTFRYSLLDGVRDNVLINPTVVDARTDVTTQLLSEQGFVVSFTDAEGEDHEETYKQREFEKHQEAIVDFDKAIELDSKSVFAYNNRGVVKVEVGDYQGAILDYDKVLEINPQFVSAYKNRGVAKSALGDDEGADEDFATAQRLDLQYADAYTYRGSAKSELGQYHEAISDYDEAIELDPQNVLAYYNRGNAKSALGDYQSAISDYDKAIELNPQYVEAYTNRGITKGKSGDYQSAILDFDKAIEYDPKCILAYTYRGNAKGKLGQHQDAISDYDKAIELDPQNADAYYNRGVAKNALGDYRGAISDYNEAIECDPQHANAYYNRGLTKSELGDYQGAILDYDKAIECNPKDTDAYNNRGIAKGALDDYQGAISDFDTTIEYDPQNADAYYYRGLAKSALGDDKGAAEDFATAQRLDPNGYENGSN